jgi:TRAP-type mannitol/chloroaromatic compound transport system permease small subunit
MQSLLKFSRVIDAISERLGWLSMMLVILTVVVGFYNVLARYVGRFVGMQLSSNVFIETQWYLFSLVFFLSFGYILKNGINVRVDFIYTHWTKRRKALLDFWGHLLFLLPYCLLGIWVTVNPVITSWIQWEQSPDPGGLARAPIKSMIIVAFLMLTFQTISELIKLWAVIRGENIAVADLDVETPLRIE